MFYTQITMCYAFNKHLDQDNHPPFTQTLLLQLKAQCP